MNPVKNNPILLTSMAIGPMLNLAYFIGDANSREVALVDPGWDSPTILAQAKKDNLTITCILLTHGHYDHVDAADAISQTLNIPVFISDQEIPMYLPACAHLKKTKHHQQIIIGEIAVTCLHTPGHTPGCQCFYAAPYLLTGDTLFVGGCGRCDFPGGDEKALLKSLHHVIAKLPDDTIIAPGHSYGAKTSTLGKERKTNPSFCG